MRGRRLVSVQLRHAGAWRGVFQSKLFAAACSDLPQTPGGQNPYNVLELTVTPATTMEDVSKQFRNMVVQNHPDKPGGSTEKMSEINLAYQIIKDHHESVLRNLKEAETRAANVTASNTYRQRSSARASRDEDLGRSGGLYRRNVVADVARRPRSPNEIAEAWDKFRDTTEGAVRSMCNRYELAVQQGRFFRKSATLNEITVRERWLRKSFIKGVWEDVHEMRGELLRRGTRNARQSELAEEMVQFATTTQRKLNEDFQRTTQLSVNSQSRMFVQRLAMLCLFAVLFVKFWRWLISATFNNTLTVRLKHGVLST